MDHVIKYLQWKKEPGPEWKPFKLLLICNTDPVTTCMMHSIIYKANKNIQQINNNNNCSTV